MAIRIKINLTVQISYLYLFFFLFTDVLIFAQETDLHLPDKIEYAGQTYNRNTDSKNKELIIKMNTDRKATPETIASFSAYLDSDRLKRPVHFLQIYKFIKTDNDYKPIKTLKLDDYSGQVLIKDFNQDGINEIAIFSHKEKHYTHIYIYKWKDGDYILLWDKRSYCGVEVGFEVNPAIIKVASSDLSAKILNAKGQEIYWCYAAEPLWEVYSWDGNTFSYRQDLSTAEPLKKMH